MKKIRKIKSIRQHLMMYSASVILILIVVCIYSLNIINQYREQVDGMFQKHVFLSRVEEKMNDMDQQLLGYLRYKSSTRLNEYNINSEELRELFDQEYKEIYTTEDMMMKNIYHLLEAYFKEANRSIAYKRQRNVNAYYRHYLESEKIKKFTSSYIDELNNKQLTLNSYSYLQLAKSMPLLETITYAIMGILILLSLGVAYQITSKMIRPISNLTQAATEIGHGQFDTSDIIVETEDEFLILAKAFNKMKNSISAYVTELTEKAETEAQLKDEQLKNVKMEHLLDNARLYALQSQINPHFLFNTINAGVQLSVMEGADKTAEFFESMSRLFRYNIQKMGASCTLSEEIQNIKDYYDLLKVRFGSRIQFEFHIDEDTLLVEVPPLILQPLVENAYIHGLSGLEEGGTIQIITERQEQHILIHIKDTGKGMTEDTIRRILSKELSKRDDEEFGIGVRNVRDRLEAFYHRENIFSIKSQVGTGTEIQMEIFEDKSHRPITEQGSK